MDIATINNNNNTNPSNDLKGINTGEMDMIGEYTILCESINISKNSYTHTHLLHVTTAPTQVVLQRRRCEQGKTTIPPTLFSN